MKTIFLIRHSEPEKNKTVPTEEIPLSDRGQKRALVLSQHPTFLDLKDVVSSPYRRANETALYFSARPRVDVRLRERELGDPETLDAFFWERQYLDYAFKNRNGESFLEVRDRMTAAIRDILHSMQDGEHVVVVSHAAAICAYLSQYCEICVTDPKRKQREIKRNGTVILSGTIETPSVFQIQFQDDTLLDLSYFDR